MYDDNHHRTAPPHTLLRTNSLFICLYSNHDSNEGQNNTSSVTRISLVVFSFSSLLLLVCPSPPKTGGFHFDTNLSQSYEKNENNRPQFYYCYSIDFIQKFTWNMRGELFWSLCVTASLSLSIHSNVLCAMTLNIKSGHSEVTGRYETKQKTL